MSILNNPRHEQFSQLVASGLSATKAYTSVGFSKKGAPQSANKLLKKTDIAARITELSQAAQQSSAVKFNLNRAWVIAELVDNVKKCKQDEAVRDKEGKPTGEYVFNATAANRALELLGKELGMFVDRTKAEHIVRRLSDLSDEELAILAADAVNEHGESKLVQ